MSGLHQPQTQFRQTLVSQSILADCVVTAAHCQTVRPITIAASCSSCLNRRNLYPV